MSVNTPNKKYAHNDEHTKYTKKILYIYGVLISVRYEIKSDYGSGGAYKCKPSALNQLSYAPSRVGVQI